MPRHCLSIYLHIYQGLLHAMSFKSVLLITDCCMQRHVTCMCVQSSRVVARHAMFLECLQAHLSRGVACHFTQKYALYQQLLQSMPCHSSVSTLNSCMMQEVQASEAEDADLQEAIARSLRQEQPGPARPRPPYSFRMSTGNLGCMMRCLNSGVAVAQPFLT